MLLPDHLHCLWSLPEGDGDYSARWALIKRGFTKRVAPWVGAPAASASREKHREGTVWQRRFWEHMVRDYRDFALHCDYVHYNPAKHGLVAAPRDWPWSTFHRFVERGLYPTGVGLGIEGVPGWNWARMTQVLQWVEGSGGLSPPYESVTRVGSPPF